MKQMCFDEQRNKWVEIDVDEIVNDCEFEDDIDYLMEEFLKGPQCEY